MLSHIKDLFRQRREKGHHKFFTKRNKSDNNSNMKVRSFAVHNDTTANAPARKIVLQSKNVIKKPSAETMVADVDQDTKSTAAAADELASLLVKQDNKRRSQLPTYAGMERFEIIRKLGE